MTVFEWIEAHSGLAAWLQAVGALIGIFIAIWVSGAESRNRMRIEKAARRDAIIRCKWVLANSGDVMEKVIKSIKSAILSQDLLRMNIERLNKIHEELRELASGPGMDADIVGTTLNARIGVDQLNQVLQEWSVGGDRMYRDFDSLERHLTRMDSVLDNLDKMLYAVT